ncbi:unnamed protein product [Spirodela intermedia]|uniref:aldehyde oxygenase (deformylating) n=1 Tax=Spirodela intermedia TaxID=51605 RepID=A0A7I8JI39_SPIIN|nr:unnamed protein product [Spirodela intermedia]CAA6669405.1 unnamed protein product [Spirodela intermedia]
MLTYYPIWKGFLTTHFSEFQLASVATFLLHESVFFLSGIPFMVLERAGLLSKYKIQGKNNTMDAQEKCVLRLILYHFCVNFPVMIVSYPIFRSMGMRITLPLPPWKVVLSQIVFYFILEDFIFYWGHRVLHTKWLYKHVHSVHHDQLQVRHPFGLTSEYAHPAEILFLGFATILGPALTGPICSRSGCGWSSDADFHDYHHRVLYTKSGNYSSTFTYMDWLFGTDKGYRAGKAALNGEGKQA